MSESPSATGSKTVFIIGAGASAEVGLPVGSNLKALIAKTLDIYFERGSGVTRGDLDVYQALRLAAEQDPKPNDSLQALYHAGLRIRDAMPQAISIDNFIDTHSGDKQIELCGKLAIVRTILDAESRSRLFIDYLKSDRKLNFVNLQDTWFGSFFMRLFEN